MTTTLLEAEQELSRQIGDFWSSTTTSAGLATTLVDTELQQKATDWITDEAYDLITSATTYIFIVTSASATVGATYTNNSVTFTVLATIAPDTTLYCSATSAPATSGTLTKATGSGDTTITFSSYSTCENEERKISSLLTSTLTTLAHSGLVATGTTYEVHRLFSASEKRRALVAAAQRVYPFCFTEIWDETLVSGNWLKDGSFEIWTGTTDLTHWTDATVTTTQTATAGYVRQGVNSVKLSGSLGTLVQEWKAGTAEFEDLRNLRGRSVTFTCQVWADTADDVRISVNDGTTQTYSEYHDGDDAWTQDNPRNDGLYVTQYIDPNATQVTFTVHWGGLGTAAYVDDARVISNPRGKLYIGHLGLQQNRPHQVLMEPSYYSQQEDWIKLFDWKVDPDGYLYIPTDYPSDRRLRIRGLQILDFLLLGVTSTAWTAAIDIEQPQLEILVAEAALYLYTWMSMPNYESGTREDYQQMMAFWQQELASRRAKFGMRTPGATIHTGVH